MKSFTNSFKCILFALFLSLISYVTKAQMTATATVTNITCYGNYDGTITIKVIGGTSPYQYSKDSIMYQYSNTFNYLMVGNYKIWVKDANNLICKTTASITQPASALKVTGTFTNATNNNGTITTTVSGGTPPYNYSWYDTSIYTQNRTGLKPGNYTVYVTDTNYCSTSATFTITNGSVLSATAKISSPSCFGGSGTITINAIGGTAPYQYRSDSISSYSTSNVFHLKAGNFIIGVKDANNTTYKFPITVNQPSQIAAIGSVINETASGAKNGSINLTVSGGTKPYRYYWYDYSTFILVPTRTNLAAGTYQVDIADSNQCYITQTYTVGTGTNVGLSATANIVNILCYNGTTGTVTINALGGTSPYQYRKDSLSAYQSSNIFKLAAGTYTFWVKDTLNATFKLSVTITKPSAPLSIIKDTFSAVSKPGATDGYIHLSATGGTPPYYYSWYDKNDTVPYRNNLATGTYTAYVSDSNNCSVTKVYTIGIKLSATTLVTNVACFGNATGSITVNAVGGKSPYYYKKDSLSNYQNTNKFSGLKPGTYQIWVLDAAQAVYKTIVIITQPLSALSVTSSTVHPSAVNAADGSIQLIVTGGNTPYTYLWNDNATSQNRTGLNYGFYSVAVTDSNNCSVSTSFNFAPLTASVTTENERCYGDSIGTINIYANGGTPPYQYKKDSLGIYQNNNYFSGLKAGTYSIWVKDSTNITYKLTVTIAQPTTPLIVVSTIHNETATGAANGSISLHISGGAPPYNATWDFIVQDTLRTNLVAGNYNVDISDSFGCYLNKSYTIGVNSAPLHASAQVNNVLCSGDTSGSIKINATGGYPPYMYKKDSAGIYQTSNIFNFLASGTYTIWVKDSLNTIYKITTNITQPAAPLLISSVITNANVDNTKTGAIALTITGGTSPYMAMWNDSVYTINRTGINNGIYTVYVTDSNNCYISKSFTVDCINVIIAGNVITTKGNPLKAVKVLINSTNMTDSMVTDSTGKYAFTVPKNNSYSIKAMKLYETFKSNGVSSIDAALIQSNILGKTLLNSPNKLIASDVNGDKKISALDIVFIKRLILNLDTIFTNNNIKRLWVFEDSSYKFTDTTNPFPIKDSFYFNNITNNKTNQTFIGIKLGDVNWDWNPALLKAPNNELLKKEEVEEIIE